MGRFSGVQYIKDQCFLTLPDVSSFAQDLSGKTVIVIGANVGLGYEAAKHFASMKPTRVILGCRTKEKAETAAEEIQQTASSETTVEPWQIDLADFKSVSSFADRYETEGNGRLDLLVMNAGVNTGTHSKDESGWEKSLKINHLGTSLLTLLLLPYIKKAPFSPPTPRIVIVGSEVHYLTTFETQAKKPNILEALNEETSSGAMRQRYFQTKLLNLFFARALATRLPSPSQENHNPIVTNVNPGWCKTQLNRDQNLLLKYMLGIFKHVIGRTAEEGSRTIVWAALAHLDDTLHGRYTTSCRIDEESDYSLSPEGKDVENRIWNETISVLEVVDSRVTTIVQEQLINP